MDRIIASKNMSNLSPKTDPFIAELDQAIEAHTKWTHRVLRCAVLHTLPGADVTTLESHTLCEFGLWFSDNKPNFEVVDAACVQRIEIAHKDMHDAIRAICTHVMAGKPGEVADLELFEKSQSEILTLLANFKTFVLSNAQPIDPLTELPLRHNIEKDFILCQKDALRHNTLLYVAMIDVDSFKNINDKYGHPVGDIVLSSLADTLKHSLRGNDHLYRFGGEEFLWLMRCQHAEQAEQSARRTVITVRTTPVPISDNESLSISVTIGLTCVAEHEHLSSAIGRADIALYEGKNAGRDRYVIS
jgi:diguanylate cyclase (GGDEF)-like protein